MADPVYVALDFETADYQPDSACAVGLAKVRGGEVVDTLYSLIRPPRRRILFTWVHGITWKDVQDSPTFLEFGRRWLLSCKALHILSRTTPLLIGGCWKPVVRPTASPSGSSFRVHAAGVAQEAQASFPQA